jgi:hypothetical protein
MPESRVMTHGQIHREFAAGRLTAREAADLTMEIRTHPRAAWRGLAFVVVVVVGSYCLFGLARGWRLP